MLWHVPAHGLDFTFDCSVDCLQLKASKVKCMKPQEGDPWEALGWPFGVVFGAMRTGRIDGLGFVFRPFGPALGANNTLSPTCPSPTPLRPFHPPPFFPKKRKLEKTKKSPTPTPNTPTQNTSVLTQMTRHPIPTIENRKKEKVAWHVGPHPRRRHDKN